MILYNLLLLICMLVAYPTESKSDDISTCSCAIEGNAHNAVMEELEQTLTVIIDKQLESIQKVMKALESSSECSPSLKTHLQEIEEQTENLRSLTGGSIIESEKEEPGFGQCTSALESFTTKVLNAADDNRKVLSEAKIEREKLQTELKEKFTEMDKTLQQKTEKLEVTFEENKKSMDKKVATFNIKLTTLNETITKNEKELVTRFAEFKESSLEKACNCPSMKNKLDELTQVVKLSVSNQDMMKKQREEDLKEQNKTNTELEDKIKEINQNLQMKNEENKKLLDDNLQMLNEKLTSQQTTIDDLQNNLKKISSEQEASVPANPCDCPAVNEKLEELTRFMNLVKQNLAINRFFLIDNPFTYDEAVDICKQHGASLAVIPDGTTQRLMEEKLRPTVQSGAWIGMTSKGRLDGIFEWNDGKTVNTKNKNEGFQNWHPVNPEDYPKGLVCVRIIKHGTYGKWADDACSIKQAAICELPMF